MPRSRKPSPPPKSSDPTEDDVERVTLPSDSLRDVNAAETFRVWHDTTPDPHHIGEFVVTVSREGVRVWPSHLWDPSKLDATDAHDPGDPDAHPGYLTEWWELEMISGRAAEIVDDRRSEIREIERELASWTTIRAKEAHRIARAREIERHRVIRTLIDQALRIRSVWMPSGRSRVTWREMVRRRRDTPA